MRRCPGLKGLGFRHRGAADPTGTALGQEAGTQGPTPSDRPGALPAPPPEATHLRSLSLSTFLGRLELRPSVTAGSLTLPRTWAGSWKLARFPDKEEPLQRREPGPPRL